MAIYSELVTPPAGLPVSLAEAKNLLKIDDDLTEDDALVTGLIASATEFAEIFQSRKLMTQTWELCLPFFPSCQQIELPYPPLQSVTWIKYVDYYDGTTQTWDPSLYEVSHKGVCGFIRPVIGQSFPIAKDTLEAVTIRFVCGYGDNQADVPEVTRLAIQMHVKLLYDYRGDNVDLKAVESLLTGNRVMSF